MGEKVYLSDASAPLKTKKRNKRNIVTRAAHQVEEPVPKIADLAPKKKKKKKAGKTLDVVEAKAETEIEATAGTTLLSSEGKILHHKQKKTKKKVDVVNP